MQSDPSFDTIPLIVIGFAIGLLPFFAMMVTSYTKIVVVLGLLRNALGVQQVPPNMVLNGLALIVSAYVMAPVGMDAYEAMMSRGGGGGIQKMGQAMEAARDIIAS